MILALDFETFGIEARPAYPPTPVGIAVFTPEHGSDYFAWGHPTENNIAEHVARERVQLLMDAADKILCHNAPFDLSIIEEKWGLTVPWAKVEDTMVQAFIDNPHGELVAQAARRAAPWSPSR